MRFTGEELGLTLPVPRNEWLPPAKCSAALERITSVKFGGELATFTVNWAPVNSAIHADWPRAGIECSF